MGREHSLVKSCLGPGSPTFQSGTLGFEGAHPPAHLKGPGGQSQTGSSQKRSLKSSPSQVFGSPPPDVLLIQEGNLVAGGI